MELVWHSVKRVENYRAKYLILPLGILAVLSVLVLLLDLDLRVSGYFWSESEGWSGNSNGLFLFLYKWGPYPVFMAVVIAILMAVFKFRGREYRFQKRACLLIVLLLAIGPGLVVNAIFKKHYGRPRPRAVEQFGGEQKFVPLFIYNPSGSGKSFPSGHASMGFFWLGLIPLAGRYGRPLWVWGLLGAGLLHGGLMGAGRIAQGGHFLGDVIWSAGADYLIGYLLCYLLFRRLVDSQNASDGREELSEAPGCHSSS